MLALLHCESRSCRAAFEAEGTREAISELRCPDCDSHLKATGWADAEPREHTMLRPELRRAA